MSTEKTRILVVDDEAAIRAMAKAMLEGLGFEAVLANSGEQAVDLYHQSQLSDDEKIIMAIMDLTLPGGMSGVEALRELHEMDEDLPVVATSGYLEENAYEICQQIGFVGVLPKPYQSDKLRALVNWVVSNKGVPGGFSKGMPTPESEVEKKKVEVTPGGGAPEQSQGDRVANQERDVGNAAGSGSEMNGDHQKHAAESRNFSLSPSNDSGNGVADRLGDLVDVAISHRGDSGD